MELSEGAAFSKGNFVKGSISRNVILWKGHFSLQNFVKEFREEFRAKRPEILTGLTPNKLGPPSSELHINFGLLQIDTENSATGIMTILYIDI